MWVPQRHETPASEVVQVVVQYQLLYKIAKYIIKPTEFNGIHNVISKIITYNMIFVHICFVMVLKSCLCMF